MTDTTLSCARHGTTTRLRCAECDTPICPACLVKTDVGLKCPDHAAAVVTPRLSPKRRMRGMVLAAVGLAAIVGGGATLVAGIGSNDGESGPEGQVPVGLPSPDRI